MKMCNTFIQTPTGIVRYDLFVLKLFKREAHEKMLSHAVRGVCSESGEIADCVKKHLDYEQELDIENLIEEIGDMRFYLQVIQNLFGIDELVILQKNADKLIKRYPGMVYSDEAAAKRADK